MGFLVEMKSWRSLLNADVEAHPRPNLTINPVSLLYPGVRPEGKAVADAWVNDLALETLVRAMSDERRYVPFIRQTLSELPADPQVIAWRQAVMTDFIDNPTLVTQIEALLPRLQNLQHSGGLLGTRKRNLLLETSDKLAELDLYTGIVQNLYTILKTSSLQSQGLITLRDNLRQILDDESFQSLCRELPGLRAPLEHIASLTIGINLDLQLQPKSAVLLSINNRDFGEPVSLLNRLIGIDSGDGETGIAPLHRLVKDPDQRIFSPLFQDLDRLLTAVAQPIAQALKRYVRTTSSPLLHLEYELAFFVSAVRLLDRFKQVGVDFCQPEIVSPGERLTKIENLVSANLVVSQAQAPIPSDVDLDDEGRIAILTGPNSGGKTTYAQAVGLAQVMFQAGMCIPARYARMSPVDTIQTHFPRQETGQQGRLAEEAGRLREVFGKVTSHSLVLLNETFASTSSGEALYLAQDILCALRAVGVRAIYATHLVELAEHRQDVEAAIEGDSRLCSLVAGVKLLDDGTAEPTYQITRDEPLGRSFAQEIARRHGISLAQILENRKNAL